MTAVGRSNVGPLPAGGFGQRLLDQLENLVRFEPPADVPGVTVHCQGGVTNLLLGVAYSVCGATIGDGDEPPTKTAVAWPDARGAL